MMKLINCITILLVVVYTNAQPAGMMDEVEENVVRSLISPITAQWTIGVKKGKCGRWW